jgi:circadian clock protein KaiC
MAEFGWDIPAWEAAGTWAFVDGSPAPGDEPVVTGRFDLGGLLSRIEHAVRRVGAKRVSLDSIGGIFGQFTDAALVRG